MVNPWSSKQLSHQQSEEESTVDETGKDESEDNDDDETECQKCERLWCEYKGKKIIYGRYETSVILIHVQNGF